MSIPPLPGPGVFIAVLGEEARNTALKLAADLRRSGLSVLGATGSRSLKSQLRQANNLGVRYTVIIGEEEVKSGSVQLRDMKSSQQQNVPLDGLRSILQ